MAELLHQLVERSAQTFGQNQALKFKDHSLNFQSLWLAIKQTANGFCHSGLQRQQRVAIYLPKQLETVIAFFASTKAGAIFVPINPSLKGPQVNHILNDCEATILITSNNRLKSIASNILPDSTLATIICVDAITADCEQLYQASGIQLVQWDNLDLSDTEHHRVIDADIASILYTSGSTGKPKGVVLSHQNMVAGAKSVAEYLENSSQDKILAVLPFSFDYGFSQLSTAFLSGASVVLMDYLFPRDVIKIVAKEQITGLAAVPPLWIQLAQLEWPKESVKSLRYITNSGGAMPIPTLNMLQESLPNTKPYLMYGLTEAFRSTYLAPEEIHNRPDSMGKAIPNAEVIIVRPDGSRCDPDEPGELVHRGALVALGYWNDPEKTAERFKPAPQHDMELPLIETAVWSGDTVRMDQEGFLYFIGRTDDMIKTSGFRVSPSEVEDIIYKTELVHELVALGIPHPSLGQAIIVVASAKESGELDAKLLLSQCSQLLPSYMVPIKIINISQLPRNANGKIDRKKLSITYQSLFQESSA